MNRLQIPKYQYIIRKKTKTKTNLVKILVIDKIQYIFVKKDYIWVNLSLIKSGDASKGEQDLPLYVGE